MAPLDPSDAFYCPPKPPKRALKSSLNVVTVIDELAMAATPDHLIGQWLMRLYPEDGETPEHVVARIFLMFVNAHKFYQNSGQGTWYFTKGQHSDVPPFTLEEFEKAIYSFSNIHGPNVIVDQVKPEFNFVLNVPITPYRPKFLMKAVKEWFHHNPNAIYRYGFEMQRFVSDEMMREGAGEVLAKTDSNARYRYIIDHKDVMLTKAKEVAIQEKLVRSPERFEKDLLAFAKLPDFEYEAKHSFVSGGSDKGIYETLNATVQQVVQPPFSLKSDNVNKENLDDIMLGYLTMLSTYAPRHEEHQLTAPNFSREEIGRIPFDPSKAAGFVNRRVQQTGLPEMDAKVEHLIEQRVLSLAKGNTYLVEFDDLYKLFLDVKKCLAGDLLSYDRSWFPLMASKIALKAEVRNHDVSKTKVRVFFIVSFLKYLLDKYIYGAPLARMQNIGEIGIGFNRSGGAYDDEFARVMEEEWLNARKGGIAAMDSDLHKMDQSMLAIYLNWVCLMPLFFYKREYGVWEDGKYTCSDYEVLRAAMAFSADDIAISLIKWVGNDYRWICGVMFSGLVVTSIGDTLYSIWGKNAFRNHACRLVYNATPGTEAEKLAEVNEFLHPKFAKKYGDDLLEILSLNHLWVYVKGEPCSLQELQATTDMKPNYMSQWLKTNFNVSMKMAETRIFTHERPYLTTVDAEFDTMVIEGPKYLQRRTVAVTSGGGDPNPTFVPWRVTNDYIAKAVNTTSLGGSVDAAYWLVKFRGLMIDTCGTNKMAYAFLRYMDAFLCKIHHGLNDILRAQIDFYNQHGYWVDGTGRALQNDLPPLFKKLGAHFDLLNLEAFYYPPDRIDILHKYKKDSSLLRSRHLKRGLVATQTNPMTVMYISNSKGKIF